MSEANFKGAQVWIVARLRYHISLEAFFMCKNEGDFEALNAELVAARSDAFNRMQTVPHAISLNLQSECGKLLVDSVSNRIGGKLLGMDIVDLPTLANRELDLWVKVKSEKIDCREGLSPMRIRQQARAWAVG